MDKKKLRHDALNLNKGIFPPFSTDYYEIPLIHKQKHNKIQLSPFHNKPSKNKYAHFFLDDYQFERVWNQPARYNNKIQQYQGTLTPDFSLYTEYQLLTHLYNTLTKEETQ